MKGLLFALSTAVLAFGSASALADSAVVVFPGNGHSYQRFDETLTWSNARASCSNRGGYLATFTSEGENDYVYQNVAQEGVDIWLGGTDEGVEGTWQWVTGETWSYTNWFPNQPDNNAGSGQDYLAFTSFDTLGRWDDAGLPSEDFSRAYICEWNTAPALASGVPTLTEWGVLTLSLVLAIAAAYGLRSRSAR